MGQLVGSTVPSEIGLVMDQFLVSSEGSPFKRVSNGSGLGQLWVSWGGVHTKTGQEWVRFGSALGQFRGWGVHVSNGLVGGQLTETHADAHVGTAVSSQRGMQMRT